MPAIVLAASVENQGDYRTKLTPKNNSFNEEDYQTIEKILPSNTIERKSNEILSKQSLENVVQLLEDSQKYFLEIVDQQTNVHQLTPTNWAQGKTPQLRN